MSEGMGGNDTAALTVTRWRKHGIDRLYVGYVSGARVGWVDLRDGSEHFEGPVTDSSVDAFRAAIAAFCRRHSLEAPAGTAPASRH
jgi:hypothetical protein